MFRTNIKFQTIFRSLLLFGFYTFILAFFNIMFESCNDENVEYKDTIDEYEGNDGATQPETDDEKNESDKNHDITAVDGSKLEELYRSTITPHTNPELFDKDEELSHEFNGEGKAYGNDWFATDRVFASFDFHPDNVSMSGGNLNISIRYNMHDVKYGGQKRTMYFQSGMLSSKKETTYGYYEARIKGSPLFKGTCSAFWLYNLPWKTVEHPYAGKIVYNEIDVIELQQVPKDFHIMSCNYHIMVLKDDLKTREFIRPNDMWGTNECLVKWDTRDDFHVYACENRPDSIIWYIDNCRVASLPNYYWHLPMQVTLSLGARTPFVRWENGLQFPVPTTKEQADAAGFPSTMQVDYIRTWERKDYSPFKSSKREYSPVK